MACLKYAIFQEKEHKHCNHEHCNEYDDYIHKKADEYIHNHNEEDKSKTTKERRHFLSLSPGV